MVAADRRAARQMAACQICGGPVGTLRRPTCSKACGYKYRTRHQRLLRRPQIAEQGEQIRTCEICGSVLPYFRGGQKPRTCSREHGIQLRARKTREAKARTLPTPEEIARMCAEIQAGWPPGERLRRSGVKRATILRLPDSVLFGRVA
jgi:hypothetical protein